MIIQHSSMLDYKRPHDFGDRASISCACLQQDPDTPPSKQGTRLLPTESGWTRDFFD